MNYKAQKIDFSLFFDQRPPLDHARLRHPLRGAVFDVAAGAMTGYKVWLSRGCPFRQSVQTFFVFIDRDEDCGHAAAHFGSRFRLLLAELVIRDVQSRGCPFRQSVQT